MGSFESLFSSVFIFFLFYANCTCVFFMFLSALGFIFLVLSFFQLEV